MASSFTPSALHSPSSMSATKSKVLFVLTSLDSFEVDGKARPTGQPMRFKRIRSSSAAGAPGSCQLSLAHVYLPLLRMVPTWCGAVISTWF